MQPELFWFAFGQLILFAVGAVIYFRVSMRWIGHPNPVRDAQARCAQDFAGKLILVCLAGIAFLVYKRLAG